MAQQRIADLLRNQPPAVDAEGLLFASGGTVPADGTSGYQTGCLFVKTSGGANDALYVNEGTFSSSAFVVAGTLTAAQQTFLTGITAGTVTASKAVVVDASKDIKGFRDIQARALVIEQGNPTAVADGDTAITAANLQTKILTMAATGARAPTVPTGTAVNGIIGIGQAIDWSFINLAAGAHTITVTEATAHTLVGKMTLAQHEQGIFRTRCSGANTAITYRLA